MAKNSQKKGPTTQDPKAAPKRPPRNFVIAWRPEAPGEPHGYAVVELVAYFPTFIQGDSMAADEAQRSSAAERARRNASDHAFRKLFPAAAFEQVALAAVALPSGSVSDPDFQMYVASMSG